MPHPVPRAATRTVIAVVGCALALSACSEDRFRIGDLNPFGASRQVSVGSSLNAPPGPVRARPDDRALVDQVTALRVQPTAGGVLVEARGLPGTQGFHDAALVPAGPPEGGVLTLELRARPPAAPRPAGPATSREVVTATFLSDAALGRMTAIRVSGLSSAREARR